MITALPPLKHQIESYDRFQFERYGAFFCEMGTGKTKMILDLILNSDEQGALVLAPNGLHYTWFQSEIPKHAHPSKLPLMYCWKGTPTSQKAQLELRQFMNAKHPFKVFLANIEAIRTKSGFEPVEKFLRSLGSSHMIIDESTCIKNPKAQQTKAALKLAPIATRRWILNGTPITQGPLDLFAQCRFLDPSALRYTTYTAFKNTFAQEELITLQNRSFRKIVGYQNLELLTNELKPFTLKLDKADCLDLPDKVFTERIVELTPAQKQAYKSMRDLCVAFLESGEAVTANIALTKLLKLHQITTGFVTDENETEHALDNNRLAALMDIAETQKPLVVFCAYKNNIRTIEAALKKRFGDSKVVTYYSDTPREERKLAEAKFQQGVADFFIGGSAAAKGLTLHRANTTVYYSNTYKLETRLQSQDRIHRIGQNHKCTYIDLVSPGTLDHQIIQKLKEKKNIADMVLNDLRQLI